MYLIKDLPLDERPRERLKKYGVKSLSNIELLSILLRTGTKMINVKTLSMNILKEIPINEFNSLSYETLLNIKGMGESKAMILVSALELAKRVYSKSNDKIIIHDSRDAYFVVKDELEHELQEKFLVIYLNNKNHIISKKILFIGTNNQSIVFPRDVFREGVKLNCSSVILCHNHPSGDITPSKEDDMLTLNFIKIGRMLNINVLDHLVIGLDNYYSYLVNNPGVFEK